MKFLIPFVCLAAAGLSGCAGFNGLDASSSFACKAPPGVSCQSISGTHANAEAGALPYQLEEKTPKGQLASNSSDTKPAAYNQGTSSNKVSPRDMNASNSGIPVRQPPLVLRVWIAPYEDEGGDLYDQSYLYTMVHSGKWMIEANQKQISNQFKPVYPLNRNAPKENEHPATQSATVAPLNQAMQNQGNSKEN